MLPTKVHVVKATVFPVVMYGCDIWTIKKAEHQRIDAFDFWCWRRLLRVPWTARRSNQSTLKEISTEYSLKGLMLKVKLQYFGHLMWRTNSLEKTLMLGKIESRRRGWQRMRWLDSITNAMDEFEQALGVGNGQGCLVCCSPWGRKQLDTTEWLNWTDTPYLKILVELLLLFVYFISSEVHTKVKNYNEDPRLVLHPNAKHSALPIFSGVTYRASGQ